MPPILIWNKCIEVKSQGIGYPDYPVINSNIKCPFNCTFTNDRKFEMNVSTILFFIHVYCLINEWPQNRREDQNYMMYTVESPTETLRHYDRKFLTNKFLNSSATYRLDSSVFMPYDALTRITPTTPKEYIWDQEEVVARVKNKTRLAFQAISHCNATSGRDLISKRLQKLIGLEVVGICFRRGCNDECYNRNIGNLNLIEIS
ncbi:unnamed protein product [Meloidogyne enterolobii]|uniref:Uncharacterized protein n=1 Tax=Meloidogyne enterolobii TaxID=390850 RepID=A0ACB0ZG00_MELEN